MEQQKVHVAKGGITATLNSRCAILAAANPKEGRFKKRHKNTSVMRAYSETGLPLPLASRFDIIWMMRDEVRIHDDERIARHILDNRTTGKSEALLENSIELGSSDTEDESFIVKPENGRKEHLSQGFLRKYIAFAKRTVHPQLDQEAKNAILKYYTEERQSFGREDESRNDHEFGDKDTIIPITARALEALIRLTEAHARMHLQETATVENAKVALAVFKHWREESGIEDESEIHSGVPPRVRVNNTAIMNMISDICSEKGEAKLSDIYNIALPKKITENEVDRVVSKMLQTGQLYEASTDIYRFTR
jgi:replicative DNA helicase Mcm